MATEFGTGKTIFILAIVVGCFAILWPKIFYPMLQGSVSPKSNTIATQEHLRQERPPHLRPDIMHPALREKGRAIPQSHIVPKVLAREKQGRAYPVPGIRPPMGGAGHVVPPPKGSGTMGIIMPLYTIGIVVFFMYTMMKLIFKKTEDSSSYKDLAPDPEFHRMVFSETDYSHARSACDLKKGSEENSTKLVVTAISGLVAEVNRDILSKQGNAGPVQVQTEGNESELIEVKESMEAENKAPIEDGKAVVQVVGMEMTESCEKGQKWSRPPTPTARCVTPTTVVSVSEPQNIFLEGTLPSQSQLLVSQSETQRLPPENEDSSIILAGKVTLSLIGVDSAVKENVKENTALSAPVVSPDYVSEDEAEASDNDDNAEADLIHDGLNGDDDATNYTTASAAGGDETAADISTMDGLVQEIDEINLEEELAEELKISNGGDDIDIEGEEEEEEEEEDEEEEDDENDENEEVRPRPQSLQRQHQR